MGKLDERLEATLKDIEREKILHSTNYDPYLNVKIIIDSRYKPISVTEFSSKPGQSVTHKTTNYKSGLQMLVEELRNHKAGYYCFRKTENNPGDYVVVRLNASGIRSLASQPYVDFVYDDSPIIPSIIKNNKKKPENTPLANDKPNEKPNNSVRTQGYHRNSGELDEIDDKSEKDD